MSLKFINGNGGGQLAVSTKEQAQQILDRAQAVVKEFEAEALVPIPAYTSVSYDKGGGTRVFGITIGRLALSDHFRAMLDNGYVVALWQIGNHREVYSMFRDAVHVSNRSFLG